MSLKNIFLLHRNYSRGWFEGGWDLVRGPAGSRRRHLWAAVCQDAQELNPQCWCLRRGGCVWRPLKQKCLQWKKNPISLCLIVTNNKGLICIWKEDFCHFNYRYSLAETQPRFNGKGVRLCWGFPASQALGNKNRLLPSHGSGACREWDKTQVCSGVDVRVGLCVPLPFSLVDPCALNFLFFQTFCPPGEGGTCLHPKDQSSILSSFVSKSARLLSSLIWLLLLLLFLLLILLLLLWSARLKSCGLSNVWSSDIWVLPCGPTSLSCSYLQKPSKSSWENVVSRAHSQSMK